MESADLRAHDVPIPVGTQKRANSYLLLANIAIPQGMNRRMLLQGCAGLIIPLGGCVQLSGNTTSRSPSDQTSASVTETIADRSQDFQCRITLDDQDETGIAHDILIEVTMIETIVTDTQPARLQIDVKNEGADRRISVAEERCNLFNRTKGSSDEPNGLWLHTPGDAKEIDRRGNQWVKDAPPEQTRNYSMYGCSYPVYERGDTVSTEYWVFDDYRTEGYFEPGSYRFEEEITVRPPKTMETRSETPSTFQWGFSLNVER